MMNSLPLILLSVLLNTAAQLLLKGGMNRIGELTFSWTNLFPIGLQIASNPLIILGMAFYVLSVFVWLAVLSKVEVSVAYPIVSLGYITTAIAAYYLFGEQLTLLRMLGIGVIMLGVYLVTRT